MLGRRRIIGWLLLAALAVGAIAVALAFRHRSPRAEKSVLQPLPPNAQQQLAGYTFTRSEGGRQIFTIHAERTVAYKGNQSTLLEGVDVEVFGRRADQHDVIESKSCEYNSESGSFSCSGQVLIELNAPSGSGPTAHPVGAAAPLNLRGRQPVYLETSGLAYNQQDSTLSTTALVRWRYGQASGSGVGLEYATREGWMEVRHDVTATLPVESAPGPKTVRGRSMLHVTAARLRYAKDQQRVELQGPVQMEEGGRRLDAGHATVLLDAEERITRVVADDGVHAADRSGESPLDARASTLEADFDPPSGYLRQLKATGEVQAESGLGSRLTADQVCVSFVGAHFHPKQGTASGKVRVALRPSAKQRAAGGSQAAMAREELETGRLDFSFRPDDGTLDRASSEGAGKLTLVPSDAKAGNRVVTAGKFLMAFSGRSHLESIHGLAPTEIVFEPAVGSPAGSVPVETRADTLEAKLDPAAGALQTLEQSGHFQLRDGDRRATAAGASYSADSELLTLIGEPQLFQPDARMRADRFLVQLGTQTAEGSGHVSSTNFGPLESDSAPPLARDQVVSNSGETNVLADRVIADRKSQYVRYEGHVRAWRGADVVESPSLEIYRAGRRMVTDAGVVTSDLAPAPPPPTGPARSSLRGGPNVGKARLGATQPVVIHADDLEYFDLGRKASYRGHVRLDASGATLQADRLDAYFTSGSPGEPSKLERAVADGRVTVTEPDRRATGDHAEYFAAADKLVLTGGPPTLYDAQKGFTTGQSLTLYTQNDTLIVAGGPGSRSLSKHRLSP